MQETNAAYAPVCMLSVYTCVSANRLLVFTEFRTVSNLDSTYVGIYLCVGRGMFDM